MYLTANWPAPAHIKAYNTLRHGGVSQEPFDALNLALSVGDNPEAVMQNRELLKNSLKLPSEPIWLKQTHSKIAIEALPIHRGDEGDASFTREKDLICIVLTADCLPIFLTDKKGTFVAAIHAGWRGLANGIVESTLDALSQDPKEMLVWLGPAIGPQHFEVGDEVRDQFLLDNASAADAFLPSPNQRWLANLYTLTRMKFARAGITAVYGGQYCTYTDSKLFYSYRRDGAKTGRLASLIWISR